MVTRKRHLAKTLTWRVIATLTTAIISWLVTGSIETGVAIGLIEFIVKMGLYYAHERAWYKIPWGVKH